MTEKVCIITGAFGFLGRHLARTCSEKGWTVIGLGHGSWSEHEWQSWGISEWHTCDISIDSLLTYGQNPDQIFHCAGSGSVNFSLTHPFQDFQRTVQTSINIMEFIRLYSPHSHMIYPSSAAVYGVVDHLPIEESAYLNPISPYGIHKRIAEEICISYAHHFKINVAIIRFFSLYGPNLRKQLLWDICTKISRGDYQFFGSGKEVRDWVHVNDAAKQMVYFDAYASPEAPIVNGGTGLGVTVQEIITYAISCLNIDGMPQFSSEIRKGDPPGYIADTKKMVQFGWTPSVGWRDGVAEYIRWFKEEYND